MNMLASVILVIGSFIAGRVYEYRLNLNENDEADSKVLLDVFNEISVLREENKSLKEKLQEKELLFIKVNSCKEADKQEIFRIAQTFDLLVVDYNRKSVLVQCVKTVSKNNDMIALFKDMFVNRIEVVRGGSVAIEALSTPDK